LLRGEVDAVRLAEVEELLLVVLGWVEGGGGGVLVSRRTAAYHQNSRAKNTISTANQNQKPTPQLTWSFGTEAPRAILSRPCSVLPPPNSSSISRSTAPS